MIYLLPSRETSQGARLSICMPLSAPGQEQRLGKGILTARCSLPTAPSSSQPAPHSQCGTGKGRKRLPGLGSSHLILFPAFLQANFDSSSLFLSRRHLACSFYCYGCTSVCGGSRWAGKTGLVLMPLLRGYREQDWVKAV